MYRHVLVASFPVKHAVRASKIRLFFRCTTFAFKGVIVVYVLYAVLYIQGYVVLCFLYKSRLSRVPLKGLPLVVLL